MRFPSSVILGLAFVLACAAIPSFAQDAPSVSLPLVLPDDPSPWLGMAARDAEARLGAPSARRALPGEASLHDVEVADFQGGISLYCYDGAVWQLRFSSGYEGSVYGVFVGDGEDKIVSTLGTPWSSDEDLLVFRLAWKGYPVRLRIVLDSGLAREIYLYRADF